MEVHGTGWLWHANDWAITGAEDQSRTDTGLPSPVFEFVAVRTNRFYQARYAPQSWLECTNAFIVTQGDIGYLVDVLVDENGLFIQAHV